ncbi:hypothetical protein PsorP6_016347 [Peronosclerospora sorghi]|uniref:Uncharacterized protein n=1 Tax=Peronosclerospora sorghi TaxID=230839 RepID=A0ACC0VKG1_9STRA|nr:hypothetical protein PsorP6_016347 [Peronosclerospora sorghi]
MYKHLFLAIVAALVSTSSATPSISAVSKGSKYSTPRRDGSSRADGASNRMLQVNDEAVEDSHEERVGPPIERYPSRASSSTALHTFNVPPAASTSMHLQMEMDLIRNYPMAVTFMNKFPIDMNEVGLSLQKLREHQDTSMLDNDKLILMAIGNECFQTQALHRPYKSYASPTGQREISKKMDKDLFETWKTLLDNFNYRPMRVFEKMYLLNTVTFSYNLDCTLRDYAYMAMGSELLTCEQTPRGVPILPSTYLLVRKSENRGVDLFNSELWLEKLRKEPKTESLREEELVEMAIMKAMGEQLNLGRGEK